MPVKACVNVRLLYALVKACFYATASFLVPMPVKAIFESPFIANRDTQVGSCLKKCMRKLKVKRKILFHRLYWP